MDTIKIKKERRSHSEEITLKIVGGLMFVVGIIFIFTIVGIIPGIVIGGAGGYLFKISRYKGQKIKCPNCKSDVSVWDYTKSRVKCKKCKSKLILQH